MLHKTRAIVLHSIPYNDKYIIINMYTRLFGRVSYIVPNSRSRKAKIAHSLLQPLSVLDIEVEHLNNRDIQRIREAYPDLQHTQLYNNPSKNAIALFLAEVLYRIVQEKEPNQKLFDYLYDSIKWLEITDSGIANFHIAFLFQLSNYIGIHPNGKSFKPGYFFDLRNGAFAAAVPEHIDYLNREDSIIFARLLKMNFENMAIFSFTRAERTSIIRHIINYYRLHISDFPEIKSLAVMQSLFD